MPAVEQFGHQVGADEAGAAGDQHTAEFESVSVASPMRQSINETCSSFDPLAAKTVPSSISSSSSAASASSTRLRAPAKCSSQRLASSSPLSQSFSDASRSSPPCSSWLHDFDQLVAGFFVPQFTNRLHSTSLADGGDGPVGHPYPQPCAGRRVGHRAQNRASPGRPSAPPRSRGPGWPPVPASVSRADRWPIRSDSAATSRVMSRRAAVLARWISSARAVSAASGWASTGRLRSCASVCCSRCTQLRSARALRRRRSATQRLLGGGVGHDPLGGVGRGGRAQVGDEVAQRVVGFVADGADHRCGARGDRPAQRLVGERQQVLDAAAAAGEHDDVDVGSRVEFAQRLDDLRERRWAPARRCCGPRSAPRASGRSATVITSCSAALRRGR